MVGVERGNAAFGIALGNDVDGDGHVGGGRARRRGWGHRSRSVCGASRRDVRAGQVDASRTAEPSQEPPWVRMKPEMDLFF
jgi:hypothetical protein